MQGRGNTLASPYRNAHPKVAYNVSLRGGLSLLLVVVGIGALVVLFMRGGIGTLWSAGPRAQLTSIAARVLLRPQKGPETPMPPQGPPTDVRTGDAVRVEEQGEALLSFPDSLQVRIFHSSDIAVEGKVAEGASWIDDLRLSGGTTFNTETPDQAAHRRVDISTKWAVITAVGTKFLAYYNPQSEVTWVVVKEGKVRVEAARQVVEVPAGWQTWVPPNQPPIAYVPATRTVVNTLFSSPRPDLIEKLTNNALADADILANQQCSVQGSGLNLRTAPDLNAPMIEVMPARSRFEGLSRTANAQWVLGISASNQQGWASASLLGCAYNVRELPVIESPSGSPTSTAIAQTPAIARFCTVDTKSTLPLNLREGPSTQYKALESMAPDSRFEAQGRTRDASWLFGKGSQAQGWASAAFLRCQFDPTQLPAIESPATPIVQQPALSTPLSPSKQPSPSVVLSPTPPSQGTLKASAVGLRRGGTTFTLVLENPTPDQIFYVTVENLAVSDNFGNSYAFDHLAMINAGSTSEKPVPPNSQIKIEYILLSPIEAKAHSLGFVLDNITVQSPNNQFRAQVSPISWGESLP